MYHIRYGLSVFGDKLKEGISDRVDAFIAYKIKEYKLNPEKAQALSLEDWMIEYKEWADNQILEKQLLDVLK